MAAPKGALDYLGQNPGAWREFKSKYGTLPDGFTPPEAPAPALDFLVQNPDAVPQFEDKYGYVPPQMAQYAKTRAYAKPGSYRTKLDVDQEEGFQRWVKEHNVPNDDSPMSDYDMRGFYAAQQAGDPAATTGVNQNDGQMHFSDKFKTPFHKSFSAESQYAGEGAPSWNDKDQLISPAGEVMFDERAKPGQGGFHPESEQSQQFVKDMRAKVDQKNFKRGGLPGGAGDLVALFGRSAARLGESIVAIPGAAARLASGAVSERIGLSPEEQAAMDTASPMAAVGRSAEHVQKDMRVAEEGFMQALRPEVRKSVEQAFVERAKDHSLQFGEGASDPWWWTGMAIDTATQMAPAMASAGMSASAAYGGAYAQALAKAAAAKASTSVAMRYAEKQGVKAATKAAMIAGGSSEGLLAGGQTADSVQRTLGELDEETMMNYAPYADLRHKGLSHEAARAKVADEQALKAGLGVAVATGMTGIPLNNFIGRWVAKVPIAPNRAMAAAEGLALEGATESVQEGSQQLIQNVSQSPITHTDPWEGVLENSITGFFVGGALGGGIGAAAGAHAQAAPDTNSRVLETRLKEYNAARDNLSNAQGSALDPSIKITKDDLDASREEYRTASINLGQELLKSGKLDKKGQEAVAQSLEEARKLGVQIPETQTDVDESQLSKADKPNAGEAKVAQAEAKAQAAEGSTAGPAPEAKPVLNETQAGRLDLLKRVANAEPVTDQEINTLVSEKLANVSKAGQPVMLPAGKRMRAQLEKIETDAAVAEAAAKPKNGETGKPKNEPSAETAAAVKSETGYELTELGTDKDPPPKPHPAEKAAQEAAQKPAMEALTPEDYGSLERLASGKVVSTEDMRGLVASGLVATRDGGKTHVIRPVGRRELKAFKETRQTALERSYEPVVTGSTLKAPKALTTRAAAAEASVAKDQKAAAFEKSEKAAAATKAAQEEAALKQKATQDAEVEVAKGKEPAGVMEQALADAKQAKTKPSTATPFPKTAKQVEAPSGPPDALAEGPLQAAMKVSDDTLQDIRANSTDRLMDHIDRALSPMTGEPVRALRGALESGRSIPMTEEHTKALRSALESIANNDSDSSINRLDRAGAKRALERLDQAEQSKAAGRMPNQTGEQSSISHAEMAEAIEDVRQHLGFPINIVTDRLGFPADVQNIPGVEHAQGLFYNTPGGGEVYLVQSMTRSAQEARTNAIHEVVGHYGIRGLLGDNFNKAMDYVLASFPEEVKKAAKRNFLDINHPDPNERRANLRAAAEEVIAYASERVFENKGIDTKQTVWEKIMQFVRDLARQLKLFAGLTNGDIDTLIHRSRDYVRSAAAKRNQRRDVIAMIYGQSHFTPNYNPLVTGTGLNGMPPDAVVPGKGRVSSGPNERLRQAARVYMNRQGMNYQPPTNYLAVNLERAKRIAQAFDQMQHAPADPKVKAAYDAMIKETLRQYQLVKETGLKVEFIGKDQADPYAASPRLAIEDINYNNHLWVFPTEGGFGSSDFDPKDNPLLQRTEEFIGDRQLLANDVFRIVHDVFGHAKEGVGFRADGEENAWRQHAAMYTPLARRAMTTETRGQNSWVNFGPHGQQNQTASSLGTRYADQKIGLLPGEFWSLDEEASDKLQSAFSMQPVPHTETKEFKDWFGDSKVVDQEGQPLRVYHGTNADIRSFDPESIGSQFKNKGGFFFSSSADIASMYSGSAAANLDENGKVGFAGANVMPVYLSIKNPYTFQQFVEDTGDPEFYLRRSDPMIEVYDSNLEDVLQLAQAGGHDGIIFERSDKGYTPSLYVAFRPEQIKSAVGNSGAFDSSNPDIRFTMGPAGKYLTDDERLNLKEKQAQKMLDLFKDLPSEHEMAAVALAGKAKRGWYKKSAQAITDVFGQDAPRFAALLAALSPQTSVESNLRNAIAVWTGWVNNGRPTTRGAILKIMGDNVEGTGGKNSVLPAWLNNSIRALSTETPESVTLSGPKVNSFAANLRGETNAVTLDTWMANYALVEQKLFAAPQKAKGAIGGKSPGYLAFSARVRQAAERISKITGETWTPAEVQETIWSWAKALTELTESYGQMATAREIIANKELTDELINATPDFATLLQQPQYAGRLEDAGYGEAVGRLASSGAEPVSEGQADATPESAGQEKHLKAAAGRIDKLIDQRRAAAQQNARFTMGGVQTNGDKDLESFLGKIGAKPKTFKQRWNDATAEIGDRINMGMFDHFYGIKRAETLAGVSAGDSGYISARLSAGAGGLMRSVLEQGHPVWDGGAPNVAGEKGFFDIIKPLGDNVNTWLAWMVAKRAERLHTEGRERLFSPAEIAAAKKLGENNPVFATAAREYAKFQQKVLDFAEEAGIINPETRTVWENADYVPFYRLMENGDVQFKKAGGGLGFVKNQIKKLKGGEQNIGDPLENIMRNWSNMLEASLKAHAARLTVDNLNGTGLVTTAKVEPFTAEGLDQFKKNYPDLVTDLQSMGVDVNHLTPQAFRGIQSMLVHRAPEGQDTITVWRDGKREAWNIQDPLLFRSLQAINPESWGPWMKLFHKPKRFLTETITLVPSFAVKNIWRDMWSVFVQGTTDGKAIPIIPLYDTAKGFATMVMKGEVTHSMAAGGASFEGTGFNDQSAAEAARRAARRGGLGNAIIDTPAKAYLMYRDLLSAAENAHRVMVYNGALKAGRSRKEALYEARDLMDFSLRGNSPIMRFLVETVPFLGARVAGLSTLGRRFAANPKGVALRGLLLVAAAAAYVAANHDDDRYKGLTSDQKNNYWHFWDVFKQGDHIRIPKPFEVGTIFSTIPEVALDTMLSNADEPDKYKQALEVVGHAFANTLDLSPKVQAVWPVFELAINKNTFTGAPILNLGDQGALPQEQDSPRIHPTYRAITRVMPDFAPDAFKSPKQLQHLGQGYMGGLQDYVFAVTDRIAGKAMGEPGAPQKDAGDVLFLKDFYDVGPQRNTKYMNQLYLAADAAEKAHRSLNKASTEGRFDEILTKYDDLLSGRKAFNKAVDKINGIRQSQRAAQLSDMSPEEKKQIMDEGDEAANEISRDLWDFRPGGKLSPSVYDKLTQATTREQQVTVLRSNGMPATAGLIESLPRQPPRNLYGQEK